MSITVFIKKGVWVVLLCGPIRLFTFWTFLSLPEIVNDPEPKHE